MFFDQKFGLLFYSPIYLAAIAGGLVRCSATRDTRFLGGVLAADGRGVRRQHGAALHVLGRIERAGAISRADSAVSGAARRAGVQARAERGGLARSLGMWLAISLAVGALRRRAWPDRLMLFSDPHRRRAPARIRSGGLAALARGADVYGAHLGRRVGLAHRVAGSLRSSPLRRCSPYRGGGPRAPGSSPASRACRFCWAGPIVSATPSAGIREVTARRNDLDVLCRFDGTRFRTLDYQTLGRTTPDRLRDLLTIDLRAAHAGFVRVRQLAGTRAGGPGHGAAGSL